jgi:hypothetical protein
MYFEAIKWVLGMTDGSTASHPRQEWALTDSVCQKRSLKRSLKNFAGNNFDMNGLFR